MHPKRKKVDCNKLHGQSETMVGFVQQSKRVLTIIERNGLRFDLKDVSIEWTVLKLKQEISSQHGILAPIIELHFSNQLLLDNRRLFSYHIYPGDKITMTFRPGYIVSGVDGKTILIQEAQDTWSVTQFKQAVSSKLESVPSQSITLFYKNRILQDNCCLGVYSVQPGDIISCQIL